MTNANIKQILNNFNVESERIISKVTFSNRNKAEEKIRKSYDKVNKLGKRNAIYITTDYLDLKIMEMNLSVDYVIKKQEEKEELKEEREREREEKKIEQERQKAQKEAEKEKKKLEKEKVKIQVLLDKDQENQELRDKIRELQKQIAKKDEDIQEINDRRKRTGACYVYLISNKGSFGDDVYKIGVTRRDDPQIRVNELSNASVPFKYDVNAIIFSKDAFKLESDLHQKFSKQRVNKVNNHKEFFKLTQDQVQQVANEHEDLLYSFSLILIMKNMWRH
ncbi:MAG: DUF4041 domain-containing protein [Methanosphaera sp.]|nr:DUF4041 domain-containing protein [Methanosphaera sp.]